MASVQVPWIVFAFSIVIVMVSFISVFFPSLLLASNTVIIPGIDPITPNPYEVGPWASSIILSCVITLGLLYLHIKQKLPKPIHNILKRLYSLKVSKKKATGIIIILLAIYAIGTAGELQQEENYNDYTNVKERLDVWSIDQIPNSFEPHVRYFILASSMDIFGSYKIAPYLASIALLAMTYLLANQITQNRFAGIISMILLMQSSVFLTYDTTVSYTNFWVLFYVTSLYMVSRFWPLSAVSYLVSLPAKALTAAFLPMSIYFILRSQAPARQRYITAGITAGIIIIVGIMAATGADPTSGGEANIEKFDAKEFWAGFASFSYQLRFDGIIMLFCIPLIVGLFIASKNGIKHADSMMVLIAGIMLIAPLLTGFTNQTNQPYRFVPLVVFFAIGVGVLFSRVRGAETSR